ncbi:MAG TPA: MBL fold metallo-hydrolase [Gemmatimonadaceae bacterium]
MRQRTVCLLLAAVPCAASAQPSFHVDTLAAGVYAIVRHEPIAFVNNANSLVVVGDDGVLVVDAQFTRQATNETIAAIRALTNKPVRYVVNTHWHDDHVAGNQVYRDSFPSVVFVSQANTRADLIALGAPNRRGTVDGGPGFVARFKRLLAMGLGGDSTPVSPRERAAMESTIRVGEQYFAEAPGFRETLATLTFDDALTLYLGSRVAKVRYLGPANTRGDAVVFVPDARVVATGDLLVYPVPFAFGAFPASWRSALDSIAAFRPVAMLPGHGPAMRDDAYLRTVRDMLGAVVDQTRAAVADGKTIDQVKASVKLADYRAHVAGDDKWLNTMFTNFFLVPTVTQAFQEATRARK